MSFLTASNLVYSIKQLNSNQHFNYVNPRTKNLIKIVHITLPEGPIQIKRWNKEKGSEASAKIESISSEMLWRIANAFSENVPVNFDRVLGASYNTRSVLEALLAHTPQFYFCHPGRFESKGDISSTKKGHKHLLWKPNSPHENGVMREAKVNIIVSELPHSDLHYNGIELIDLPQQDNLAVSTDRRHCFMQVALYEIGKHLGYRTWIAQNDRGIIYENRRIIEHECVVNKLESENMLMAYAEARKRAKYIDCIWFKNGKLMPAVLEVEHSTGITSGLDRMKSLQNEIPSILTKYVIVAPDEDRKKVLNEANKEHYKSLDTRFFAYTAVEELLALCHKRKITGITDQFLDCYMERMVS